ncbi:efflux RND transporter permease subunit [Stieleria varia]|uniref:Multidrug efflux pump subunit AcrB n=1 Tax=Stieleria varia TaxID=2528005 RepID=A0A5C6AYA4_9BACT|nr:efflux RND transporter permease subunit [Stieleria varia]TWU04943.1 Multidrug efflux pump subunit AcrB [Stieleria varia]
MSIFTRFIDRPVLATVISLVIALLGAQAITRLTVRQYPQTTSTTITIVTPYIGADADLVQGFITTPLEQAIATAEGIDYLESSSTLGTSTITARLVLGYEPNEAVAEILTKIQQVRNRLPPGSEDSIVTVSTGGDQAAMYLAFTSDVLEASEITDYLTRAVRPRLETVAGVQQAQTIGSQTIAMRIWLDPSKMAALGVTPSQVRTAITQSNFLAAVGETKGPKLAIPLKAETNLDSVDAFEKLVIREQGDAIIRLRDVADVKLGAETYDSSVIFEGKTVVFIGVQIAPEANLLETVTGVRALIPAIKKQLPTGLEGTIVYDATETVEDSIDEVVQSLIEALVIVSVVIFLFLGSLRSALVPAIAMPLAIVGAFFIMQMLGYSINLLTLLALILAIGTVVDDGIVIVENATRHIEGGATPDQAAKRTVKELGTSIVAMNIVVLAVFAPIGLMGGLTGSLFTEFAYTVAGATLISGVIALTLSPMMCAKILRSKDKSGRTLEQSSSESNGDQEQDHTANNNRDWFLARWVNAGFRWLASGYSRVLTGALDARWLVLSVGVAILGSLYFLFSAAKFELAPPEDEGFLVITAQADPNVSIDQLERWTSVLAEKIGEYEGVEFVFTVNGGGSGSGGSNGAFGGVSLLDWEQREMTQMELQPQLQSSVDEIAGLQSVVIAPPVLPGAGGGPPIQFVISSIDQPRSVLESAQSLLEAARQSGKFTFIQSDLKFDKIQHRLLIDRDKAAALGVNVDTIGLDLSTMLSGGYVNFFSYDGRSYRVVPQVQRRYRLVADQILDYRVATRSGELVPMSSFISIKEDVQPRQLKRFNQLSSATLSGVPAPGVSLGEAIDFLKQQSNGTLPNNYVTDWKGVSRQFVSESSSLLLAFGLAVLLMYLTLAAQYESFRDPAVMLISVPMSIAGALVFFAAGVITVNIYTQIGLLALIGSIIRHGILLVEFAGELQTSERLDRRAAIEKAASLRLRSILMTTTATVVGLIPLLVASGGPGAASRFAISFTLGIGMAIDTLFTLFVVPAFYTVLASERH